MYLICSLSIIFFSKTRLPVKPAMTNRELRPEMTREKGNYSSKTQTIINSHNRTQNEMLDQVGHDEVWIGNEDTSFILILTPILLPYLHQLFKQGHSVSFHLAGIEEFLVMPEPVAVLEAFFGIVAGRIPVMGFDEVLHFLIFRYPHFFMCHP